MEGTPTLEQLLMKSDFVISYGPTMQDLLGIQYQGRLYKYQGMTFGLNDAPRIFTQIMKKAIHAIREIWRVHFMIYVDDLL
jgi:chromosome condensin MukBEF complex kleisin-like MukF subunit